jgi:hypothetical protein
MSESKNGESDKPAGAFDAYHELLGIAPSEQPPTLYRLLGLTPLESNASVIERAADRQMVHLRSFQTGPHAEASQRLLNEVSKARRLLLNDQERAVYDAKLNSKAKTTSPKPIPVAKPLETTPAPLVAAPQPLAVARTKRHQPNNGLLMLVGGGAVLAALAAIVWVVMSTQQSPPVAQLPAKAPPAVVAPPIAPPRVVTPPVIPPPSSNKPPADPTPSPLPEDPEEKPTGKEPKEDDVPQPPLDSEPVEPEVTPSATEQAAEAAKLKEEVAAAKLTLTTYPTFAKYYAHLQAHPESLATNGPKLAAVIWDEVHDNQAIIDHLPSHLAALQEVERLASAGQDYKLALMAIDEQCKTEGGLDAAVGRLAAANLLAGVVATDTKLKPAQRAEVKDLVQAALTNAASAADSAALATLITAESHLLRSSIDRLQAIAAHIPQAEQALAADHLPVAQLLVDHVDNLLKQTVASKQRKEQLDLFEPLRRSVTLAKEAELAKEKLVSMPDDAAANQALGAYLLDRGQWKDSLPHLAKGTDLASKELAEATLATTEDGKAIGELADKWAALDTDPQSPVKEIARHLYQEALADTKLTGLRRLAIQERAKKLGPPLREAAAIASSPSIPSSPVNQKLPRNKWVDLLPLIDFNADPVRGSWHFVKGGFIAESEKFCRLMLPVDLAQSSYDLETEIELGGDHDVVCLIFPAGRGDGMLVLDGDTSGDSSYFSNAKDRDAPLPHPAVRKDMLRANTVHRLALSVRVTGDNAQVRFSLDGRQELEYSGPIAELGVHRPWDLEDHARPALASYQTPVTYRSVRVRVVEGDGHLVRARLPDLWPAEIAALKPTWLTALTPTKVDTKRNDYFQIFKGMAKDQFISGEPCTDYILAHAPCSVRYAIPPKAKYFTAYARCVASTTVDFIVRVDGETLFTTGPKAITRVVVAIPPGSKELELVTDSLGNNDFDQSHWCLPAFR